MQRKYVIFAIATILSLTSMPCQVIALEFCDVFDTTGHVGSFFFNSLTLHWQYSNDTTSPITDGRLYSLEINVSIRRPYGTNENGTAEKSWQLYFLPPTLPPGGIDAVGNTMTFDLTEQIADLGLDTYWLDVIVTFSVWYFEGYTPTTLVRNTRELFLSWTNVPLVIVFVLIIVFIAIGVIGIYFLQRWIKRKRDMKAFCKFQVNWEEPICKNLRKE